MSNERAYNFSAGPSMLPISVIEDAAANLANYKGCGESVMEMSHRSAEFKAILEDAEKNLRDILSIPDNYNPRRRYFAVCNGSHEPFKKIGKGRLYSDRNMG